ncbi:helix-turn-helix transcriptional regulator [Clostridioides difficile]|nr:helix-turn-helix transcriptional regulator [Clostridioides difficile]
MFAKRLRELRKEFGLTQRELGEKVGVSQRVLGTMKQKTDFLMNTF